MKVTVLALIFCAAYLFACFDSWLTRRAYRRAALKRLGVK